MKKHFFATIDMGSNAIRMMIAEKIDHNDQTYQILKKQRAQLRLGHDVFENGYITTATMQSAKQVLLDFKQIIQNYPDCVVICAATSATREAKNQKEFVEFLQLQTGIQINTIDGTQEGDLIFLAIQKSIDLQQTNACLLDIGGGSIELSFVIQGIKKFTQSFPLGTVRLIENLKKRNLNENSISLILGENIHQLTDPILKFTAHYDFQCLIGTGGNIECLGQLRKKICKKIDTHYLSLNELSLIINKLQSLTLQQRIESLQLRKDRADVIIPASLIVHLIMRQLETQNLLIPHVGLRDGLLLSSINI